MVNLTKKGENGSRVCKSAGGTGKAAVKGETRRERILVGPSGTSALRLGIKRPPCDKTHSLFVRQPSAAENCEKMDRRRQKAMLVGAPDTEILWEAIEELLRGTTAGAATFWSK